jgi:hypothetical protein
MEDKDFYKIVLDTRNFEISLFWQRSNYFLVLNSALAVGFFNLKTTEYALLLSLLGLVASFLWFYVNLASKFWQSRWEHRLKLVEDKIAPDMKCFAADKETIERDVKESLKLSQHKGVQSLLDRLIAKKPSVSYAMTLLSLVFVIAWAVILAIHLIPGHGQQS